MDTPQDVSTSERADPPRRDSVPEPESRPGSGTPLSPGDCLADRFVVEREIGRGGGGAVYVAHDRKLDRDVAIKVLPRGAADDAALARFEQEARAAGSLAHPNVLAVHDVGVHAGAPFIVSELLEGATLREKISRGALPAADAVKLAVQLARGLAATHEKGIVHRDVKPENLFVLRDGRLKILDFGVAKLRRPASGSGSTDSGGFVGTVPYMSPEQVRGAPADARSDVFAFGTILHEMLSGKPVFKRESHVETGHAILTEEPPRLPSDCPPPLRALIQRCLAKDPAKRVQTARELVDLLEPLAQLPAHRMARPWPMRPWGLLLSALVGALVILLIAVPDGLRDWLRARPEEVRRLAVLSFRAMGGSRDAEAFTAGLQEVLTSKLQQVEQFQRAFRVVSVTDVLKERVTNATEARTAFGATLALTGTVQWIGTKVLVVANLVDTRTRLLVASRDVEASADDLASLTGTLLQKVNEMLALEAPPIAERTTELAARRSPAYALFLQGRGYLQRYDRIENLDRAIDAFERAIVLDPEFALAHAGRSEAWLRRYRTTKDVAALEQARASSRRALEMQPGLAQVHFTAGIVHVTAGEQAAAVERFQEALRIEPANADALRELANAYDAAGKTAEAEATFRKAVQLRPDSWAAHKDLGVFYYRRGRSLEALPSFQQVVALTPDNYAGYANLGGLHLTLGRHGDAIVALKKSLTLKPTAQAYFNLGSSYYFQRKYREAGEAYRKATEMTPSNDMAWGGLADAYRWTGGMSDESAGAYRQAISLGEARLAVNPADARLRARVATYRIAVGDRNKALADADDALRTAPSDGSVLFQTALVYEQAGDRERALQGISRAIESGYSKLEIEQAPPLDDLRRDPRYVRSLPR